MLGALGQGAAESGLAAAAGSTLQCEVTRSASGNILLFHMPSRSFHCSLHYSKHITCLLTKSHKSSGGRRHSVLDLVGRNAVNYPMSYGDRLLGQIG